MRLNLGSVWVVLQMESVDERSADVNPVVLWVGIEMSIKITNCSIEFTSKFVFF